MLAVQMCYEPWLCMMSLAEYKLTNSAPLRVELTLP